MEKGETMAAETEYGYEAAVVDGAEDFFTSTPEFVVPPAIPEAHRAVIDSVTTTTLNNEKQSTKISINVTSRDVPTVSRSLDLWVPKAYLEVIGAKTFDPSVLPENLATSYKIGFSNSDKSATLQELVFNPNSVARTSGRDPQTLGVKPVKPGDLETYVENLNKLLQGLEVIVLMKERGGEPPYNHTMEIKRILHADAYETSPKRFKGFRPMWEA
jgi:hypothetical protein